MKSLLPMLTDGHFHSGQEIADCLGVSRSAVWKKMKLLERDYGLQIHSVPGRGYCLSNPLSLLDEKILSEAMDALNWSFHLYERVNSTNSIAMQLIQADPSRPIVVMSEYQSAGRGRRGRQWVSPIAGQNLFFSLAMRLENSASALPGLSLVVGLAVMNTLRYFGLDEVGLKWPNDLYVSGRKISGILLEITGNPVDVCHLVIGIGINVNMRSSSEMLDSKNLIDQPWTSMIQELDSLVNRTELTIALANNLKIYLDRQRLLGFEAFQKEWEANHIWQGKSCTIHSGTHEYLGIVLGVDGEGALRFLINGQEQVFCAGELSLRVNHDS